jgi:hypothetical protein
MSQSISSTQRAYLAGFLDGDGSIYVQLKPNQTYRFKFQIAAYIVLYQSQKSRNVFAKLCSMIGLGYLRERRDGILEYIIGKTDAIREFLKLVSPYLLLKKEQAILMSKILDSKKDMKNEKDFAEIAKLIDRFRELNYSKKRKKRTITP